MIHHITTDHLSLDKIRDIIDQEMSLELSKVSADRITACRTYLDDKVKKTDKPIYGINTGFGSNANEPISDQDLNQLQWNLVTSHACGMGDEVPSEIVKLMILLKIQGLSYGHSGVQLLTVQRLIDFYNHDVLPIVYEQGSLGASGDLAPLAHLSLPLLGEGEVMLKGERISGKELNERMGWKPIKLQSKEGLALLNGTQFMSAYATNLLLRIERLSHWSDIAAATSLDAFDGRLEPFNKLIHQVRPHKGQQETAQAILEILEGSEIAQSEKKQVQDPYCFRCVPQVHGASKDTISYARGVVETEINSVTDNPTVFIEIDEVISAGNFHGQPLALVLDFLAIAVAELASISERRTYKLMLGEQGYKGKKHLESYLVKNPGLNSGFMIAQYAAASAVSQNKQLATPASVDTIDSSNGQEDHVSMGANAATKLKRVVDNLEKVLSIEWMAACQGLDLRKGKSSTYIEEKKAKFRKEIPFIEEDTVMYQLMQKSRSFIRSN